MLAFVDPASERRRKATSDMRQIRSALTDVLVGQGIANAKPVGAGKVRGIGDGERSRESALSHQPAMREGDPLPMGMGKRTPAEPAPVHREVKHNQPGGSWASFAYVVHTNHAVPSTRKNTPKVSFLVVVN